MMMLQGNQGNNHHGERCIIFFWGPSSSCQSIPVLDSVDSFISWFNIWLIITLNLNLRLILCSEYQPWGTFWLTFAVRCSWGVCCWDHWLVQILIGLEIFCLMKLQWCLARFQTLSTWCWCNALHHSNLCIQLSAHKCRICRLQDKILVMEAFFRYQLPSSSTDGICLSSQ